MSIISFGKWYRKWTTSLTIQHYPDWYMHTTPSKHPYASLCSANQRHHVQCLILSRFFEVNQKHVILDYRDRLVTQGQTYSARVDFSPVRSFTSPTKFIMWPAGVENTMAYTSSPAHWLQRNDDHPFACWVSRPLGNQSALLQSWQTEHFCFTPQWTFQTIDRGWNLC